MKDRMKKEKLNALADYQPIFAALCCHRCHAISKTTPFADISFRVPDSSGA
jgi:hypothetical protein